jgi:hypothetical protein
VFYEDLIRLAECEALRAAAAAAAKDTPTPAPDVVESSKKKRRRKAAPLGAHVPDHAGMLTAVFGKHVLSRRDPYGILG